MPMDHYEDQLRKELTEELIAKENATKCCYRGNAHDGFLWMVKPASLADSACIVCYTLSFVTRLNRWVYDRHAEGENGLKAFVCPVGYLD